MEMLDEHSTKKQRGLNAAIASLIEDFDLVHFLPMNKDDEDSVRILISLFGLVGVVFVIAKSSHTVDEAVAHSGGSDV